MLTNKTVPHQQSESLVHPMLVYMRLFLQVSALWGPLHGGANQAVIEMLEKIKQDGGDVDKYVDKAKDKNDAFRLMGFGHRVYKNLIQELQ